MIRVCSPLSALSAQAGIPVPPPLLEALERDLQRLMALAAADAAGVHLVDDQSQAVLRLCAQQGLTAADGSAAALASLQESLVGRCVVAQTAVALPGNAAGHPAATWEEGAASFAAAPLQVDGHVVGALWCLSRTGALADGCEATLQLLAGPVAEMAVQYERSRQLMTVCWEYQQLADHLEEAIWTLRLEPSLRTIVVSESIGQLTGYAPQDFVDDPNLWVTMIYPDDRELVLAEVQRISSGHSDSMHHRVRILRQDGEMRWAHSRGRVVRTDDELRIYGLTTDVTDHVRLEEKVRRADRLSAVGMLAGGIAHEYNNLHFAILGTLDLLLMRDDLDGGTRQHINRVREAAERASEITTKLVAFARGGTGRREVLDIAELVDSTLTLVQKEFSTLGIDVEIKLSPLPLRVDGNRAELGQVLVNLVINAQQAMQGRATKRMTIATGLDSDQRIFITVADTGHGIAPENLPRLFDPFFTTKGAAGSWVEDRAASDAFLPGRGLGLSVAQTIVEEHGGDIEVESEVDCGTRFTIHLPPPGHADDVPGDETLDMRPKAERILIADDEEAVRVVCRELLQRLEYQVSEAAGGEQAWEMLQAADYDLILVDLQMPDVNGLDLIRRINELPAAKRPTKLIITGNIDEVPPEQCAELGISGLLQKRANLSEVVTKVQLALASRHT